MPLREPGRLLVPLVSWAVLGVIAYLWLAPRSALPGWQLAVVIVAAIPLAGIVTFGIAGILGFLVSVPFELGERRKSRRFQRLMALLGSMEDSASREEARRLAGRVLEEKEGAWGWKFENVQPLLETASQPGPLQEECVSILLRHGRGGGEQARALYAGRAAVPPDLLGEWVRWFSLWAEPGEEDEEDLRPLAYAHALEHTEGKLRRSVLNRLLLEARPEESWRRVARSLDEELRALNEDELAPLERDGLAILLG